MNDSTISDPEQMSHEEVLSALFMQMVVQQANLALMLLGKVPHPESGKMVQDLDGARLFIDQLHMLEVKTKGNLSREEEKLLKQSLMTLQMAFVDAARSASPEPQAPTPPADTTPHTPEPAPPVNPPETAADESGRKKFSKKY